MSHRASNRLMLFAGPLLIAMLVGCVCTELVVSSEEYLYYLALAQRKGIPILTLDYALDSENIAWGYERSRALGSVPFVSNRTLDRYVEQGS